MTRHGKIARLPRAVREKLNERLDNGESGVRLAKWLNGVPEVKKVLRESFGGQPITPQNVSQWKCGGFCEWQARQETLEEAREMSAGAKELLAATEYKFSDYLATVLAARYAKVLSGWDGKVTEEFSTQLRALRSMCLDVAELRRGDHSRERVALEGRRLHQNRERTEREVYEMFKEWAFQPAVRNCLCKNWETPEQKEARLEEIFELRARQERGEGPAIAEATAGRTADRGPNTEPGAADKGNVIEAVGGTAAPEAAAVVEKAGEKIEVDRSKSKQGKEGARARARARERARKADEGAGETGGARLPLKAAAAGGTPAPLAVVASASAEAMADESARQDGAQAEPRKPSGELRALPPTGSGVRGQDEKAGEKIPVDPSKSHQSAFAGLRRTNEDPARQEPRADVVNARPTGSAVAVETPAPLAANPGETRKSGVPSSVGGAHGVRALPGGVPQRFVHARRVPLPAPLCKFSPFGSSVGPNSRAR